MENAEKLFVLSERRLGKTSLVRAALNRLPRKGYVHVQGLLGKDIIDREGESYLITDRFLRLWIQSAQSP
jgi:AAA+ ATPase superfamily predicted ATPase